MFTPYISDDSSLKAHYSPVEKSLLLSSVEDSLAYHYGLLKSYQGQLETAGSNALGAINLKIRGELMAVRLLKYQKENLMNNY